MPRDTKDWDWKIVKDGNGCFDFDQAQTSVLMDIRDELKRLNELLHCSNFLQIPRVLREIRRNTGKPRKKKR